ncbi:MAG TPA: DUF6716 putative glycosyltransferase, partial [Microlunatus sp.]|nr:DUF6716 putative glycosyltransferase [Microlunatus sp.]
QIADAGFDAVAASSWTELIEEAVGSDVVVCGLSGPFTLRFTVDLAARLGVDGPGPVVVTGWVGVIIEKLTAGYLDRVGSDVVAVSCVEDLDHFVTVAQHLGLDPANLLLSGLPILASAAAPPRTGPIRRVLFADQPTVPGPGTERLYLYRRLIDYAYAHPEREVLLKPRHRPGEDTFHTMRHHPEDLLAQVEHPPNFRIDYTPISEVLPEVDLLVTMSSTACLEAIGAGCRVGLVLDLGVHERYGNHVFLASGLLRTVDQLIADDVGVPERTWLDSYFFDRPGTAAQQIVDRAEKLLASGKRPSRPIWDSAYFSSTARYLRTTPLPGTGRGRSRLSVLRGVVPPVAWRGVRRLRRRLRQR